MAEHEIAFSDPGASGVIKDLQTILALINQIKAAGGLGVPGGGVNSGHGGSLGGGGMGAGGALATAIASRLFSSPASPGYSRPENFHIPSPTVKRPGMGPVGQRRTAHRILEAANAARAEAVSAARDLAVMEELMAPYPTSPRAGPSSRGRAGFAINPAAVLTAKNFKRAGRITRSIVKYGWAGAGATTAALLRPAVGLPAIAALEVGKANWDMGQIAERQRVEGYQSRERGFFGSPWYYTDPFRFEPTALDNRLRLAETRAMMKRSWFYNSPLFTGAAWHDADMTRLAASTARGQGIFTSDAAMLQGVSTAVALDRKSDMNARLRMLGAVAATGGPGPMYSYGDAVRSRKARAKGGS